MTPNFALNGLLNNLNEQDFRDTFNNPDVDKVTIRGNISWVYNKDREIRIKLTNVKLVGNYYPIDNELDIYAKDLLKFALHKDDVIEIEIDHKKIENGHVSNLEKDDIESFKVYHSQPYTSKLPRKIFALQGYVNFLHGKSKDNKKIRIFNSWRNKRHVPTAELLWSPTMKSTTINMLSGYWTATEDKIKQFLSIEEEPPIYTDAGVDIYNAEAIEHNHPREIELLKAAPSAGFTFKELETYLATDRKLISKVLKNNTKYDLKGINTSGIKLDLQQLKEDLQSYLIAHGFSKTEEAKDTTFALGEYYAKKATKVKTISNSAALYGKEKINVPNQTKLFMSVKELTAEANKRLAINFQTEYPLSFTQISNIITQKLQIPAKKIKKVKVSQNIVRPLYEQSVLNDILKIISLNRTAYITARLYTSPEIYELATKRYSNIPDTQELSPAKWVGVWNYRLNAESVRKNDKGYNLYTAIKANALAAMGYALSFCYITYTIDDLAKILLVAIGNPKLTVSRLRSELLDWVRSSHYSIDQNTLGQHTLNRAAMIASIAHIINKHPITKFKSIDKQQLSNQAFSWYSARRQHFVGIDDIISTIRSTTKRKPKVSRSEVISYLSNKKVSLEQKVFRFYKSYYVEFKEYRRILAYFEAKNKAILSQTSLISKRSTKLVPQDTTSLLNVVRLINASQEDLIDYCINEIINNRPLAKHVFNFQGDASKAVFDEIGVNLVTNHFNVHQAAFSNKQKSLGNSMANDINNDTDMSQSPIILFTAYGEYQTTQFKSLKEAQNFIYKANKSNKFGKTIKVTDRKGNAHLISTIAVIKI